MKSVSSSLQLNTELLAQVSMNASINCNAADTHPYYDQNRPLHDIVSKIKYVQVLATTSWQYHLESFYCIPLYSRHVTGPILRLVSTLLSANMCILQKTGLVCARKQTV